MRRHVYGTLSGFRTVTDPNDLFEVVLYAALFFSQMSTCVCQQLLLFLFIKPIIFLSLKLFLKGPQFVNIMTDWPLLK